MRVDSKNSKPKFTEKCQIFHYTFLFDAYVQALERMYQQKNITVAAASEHEIERLRADSDSVEGFILEECEKVDGYREERTELYKRYSVF